MIRVTGLHHASIPANDLERACAFYSEVLGLTHLDTQATTLRLAGHETAAPGERPPRHARFQLGDRELVIFERPFPRERRAFAEDGAMHQSYEVPAESFDDALDVIRRHARLERVVDRSSGRTVYFHDPEGNLVELHFAAGG